MDIRVNGNVIPEIAKGLFDADLDTGIFVEKNADEDKIKFVTDGTERMIIDSLGIDVKTNKILNVVNPTADQHAATKKYVDDKDILNFLADGSRALTATGDGFKDEDNMASDSAIAVASQQSIKKYIDDSIAALFGSYKGVEGYVWLGTVLIQWGLTASIPINSYKVETFRIAFPAYCRSVVITPSAGPVPEDDNPSVTAVAKTSFRNWNNTGIVRSHYWIAIGY